MANNLSSGAQQALADMILHTANSATWTAPASVWVGLCTSAPSDTATNECAVASNYNRVQISFQTAATDGLCTNSASCTYTSASGTWGTISGYILAKASTGSAGQVYLGYGEVSPTVAVTTNDTVSFAAGAISLTFS